MFPLVVDLAADSIAVAVTCRVLGFSTQAFSQWHSRPRQPARLGRRAADQRRRRHPPRRPGVRLPIHHRHPRRPRHHRQPQPRQPAVHEAADLQQPRPQARPQPNAGTAGPRRSGRAGVHRDHTEPVVADRHHRAPDRGRQAVSVRGQGRLHQPDRRLLHGRTHDLPAGR